MRGDDRSLTHDNQQQGELEAVLPFHLCSTPALTMSQLSPLVCLINKQLVMFFHLTAISMITILQL